MKRRKPDPLPLARERAAAMLSPELFGEFAVYTLANAYGITLANADSIIKNERQRRENAK